MTSQTKTSTDTTDETSESLEAKETDEQSATDDTADSETDAVPAADTTAKSPGSGVLGGAVAIVSSAVGLASITGTSIGDKLQARQEIIGQLQAGSGGGDQIELAYGAPWDAVAVVNAVFGAIAVILGGLVLAVYAGKSDSRSWVKVVALAGALLGVLGLGIAGAMYLDLFGSQPTMPAMPGMG